MNAPLTLTGTETRRSRASRRTDTLNTSEQLEALFAYSGIWEAHFVIPEWNGNGRPRKYPAVFALYYNAMIHIFGSSAEVDSQLDTPEVWERIRTLWHDHVAPHLQRGPDLAELPQLPYREWHYKYIRNTYLTDPDISAKLDELQTATAVDAAVEVGAFDPAKDSWTRPVVTNTIVGDATTLRPLGRKGTGQADPDADWFQHGGGDREEDDQPDSRPNRKNKKQDNDTHKEKDTHWVYGVEHYFASVHVPELGGNIIVATERVKKGQEMPVAVSCLHRIIPLIKLLTGDGPRVYLHDKAMRGTHINDIQNEFGILAASKKSKGTPASDNQSSIPFDTWDGYDIRAEGGRPVAYELDINGTLIKADEQPQRIQVKRRWSPREQKWRIHVGYEFEGTTRWLRTWNEDSDHYSRAENLRALDEQTLTTLGVGGYRSTAENVHSQLKSRFLHGRAHSKGAARQHIDNLGFSFQRNAEALWRHRQLHGIPLGQAA